MTQILLHSVILRGIFVHRSAVSLLFTSSALKKKQLNIQFSGPAFIILTFGY